MKNNKCKTIVALFTIIWIGCCGSLIRGQEPRQRTFSSDVRVERALVLMDHPLAHLITLQSWEEGGLPNLNDTSKEKRLILAEKEFFDAIRTKDKQADAYSLGQVYSYLADAQSQLALLYKIEFERNERTVIASLSKRYYTKSFGTFRRAIAVASPNLIYVIAIDHAESVISSGNLNKALAVIREYETKNIKPAFGGDYVLIRLKAEIYWTMKRNNDAALTYEKWIGKGGADYAFEPSSLIFQRLRFLKEETGHPTNFIPTH